MQIWDLKKKKKGSDHIYVLSNDTVTVGNITNITMLLQRIHYLMKQVELEVSEDLSTQSKLLHMITLL